MLERPFIHLIEMETQMNELTAQMAVAGISAEDELNCIFDRYNKLQEQFERRQENKSRIGIRAVTGTGFASLRRANQPP